MTVVHLAEFPTAHPSYVGIYVAAALTAGLTLVGWLLKDTVSNLRGLRGEQSTQSAALALIVERASSQHERVTDHESRIRVLEGGHERLQAAMASRPDRPPVPR